MQMAADLNIFFEDCKRSRLQYAASVNALIRKFENDEDELESVIDLSSFNIIQDKNDVSGNSRLESASEVCAGQTSLVLEDHALRDLCGDDGDFITLSDVTCCVESFIEPGEPEPSDGETLSSRSSDCTEYTDSEPGGDWSAPSSCSAVCNDDDRSLSDEDDSVDRRVRRGSIDETDGDPLSTTSRMFECSSERDTASSLQLDERRPMDNLDLTFVVEDNPTHEDRRQQNNKRNEDSMEPGRKTSAEMNTHNQRDPIMGNNKHEFDSKLCRGIIKQRTDQQDISTQYGNVITSSKTQSHPSCNLSNNANKVHSMKEKRRVPTEFVPFSSIKPLSSKAGVVTEENVRGSAFENHDKITKSPMFSPRRIVGRKECQQIPTDKREDHYVAMSHLKLQSPQTHSRSNTSREEYRNPQQSYRLLQRPTDQDMAIEDSTDYINVDYVSAGPDRQAKTIEHNVHRGLKTLRHYTDGEWQQNKTPVRQQLAHNSPSALYSGTRVSPDHFTRCEESDMRMASNNTLESLEMLPHYVGNSDNRNHHGKVVVSSRPDKSSPLKSGGSVQGQSAAHELRIHRDNQTHGHASIENDKHEIGRNIYKNSHEHTTKTADRHLLRTHSGETTAIESRFRSHEHETSNNSEQRNESSNQFPVHELGSPRGHKHENNTKQMSCNQHSRHGDCIDEATVDFRTSSPKKNFISLNAKSPRAQTMSIYSNVSAMFSANHNSSNADHPSQGDSGISTFNEDHSYHDSPKRKTKPVVLSIKNLHAFNKSFTDNPSRESLSFVNVSLDQTAINPEASCKTQERIRKWLYDLKTEIKDVMVDETEQSNDVTAKHLREKKDSNMHTSEHSEFGKWQQRKDRDEQMFWNRNCNSHSVGTQADVRSKTEVTRTKYPSKKPEYTNHSDEHEVRSPTYTGYGMHTPSERSKQFLETYKHLHKSADARIQKKAVRRLMQTDDVITKSFNAEPVLDFVGNTEQLPVSPSLKRTRSKELDKCLNPKYGKASVIALKTTPKQSRVGKVFTVERLNSMLDQSKDVNKSNDFEQKEMRRNLPVPDDETLFHTPPKNRKLIHTLDTGSPNINRNTRKYTIDHYNEDAYETEHNTDEFRSKGIQSQLLATEIVTTAIGKHRESGMICEPNKNTSPAGHMMVANGNTEAKVKVKSICHSSANCVINIDDEDDKENINKENHNTGQTISRNVSCQTSMFYPKPNDRMEHEQHNTNFVSPTKKKTDNTRQYVNTHESNNFTHHVNDIRSPIRERHRHIEAIRQQVNSNENKIPANSSPVNRYRHHENEHGPVNFCSPTRFGQNSNMPYSDNRMDSPCTSLARLKLNSPKSRKSTDKMYKCDRNRKIPGNKLLESPEYTNGQTTTRESPRKNCMTGMNGMVPVYSQNDLNQSHDQYFHKYEHDHIHGYSGNVCCNRQQQPPSDHANDNDSNNGQLNKVDEQRGQTLISGISSHVALHSNYMQTQPVNHGDEPVQCSAVANRRSCEQYAKDTCTSQYSANCDPIDVLQQYGRDGIKTASNKSNTVADKVGNLSDQVDCNTAEDRVRIIPPISIEPSAIRCVSDSDIRVNQMTKPQSVSKFGEFKVPMSSPVLTRNSSKVANRGNKRNNLIESKPESKTKKPDLQFSNRIHIEAWQNSQFNYAQSTPLRPGARLMLNETMSTIFGNEDTCTVISGDISANNNKAKHTDDDVLLI